MSIGVTCPACQKSFKAPDEYSGMSIKCPSCREAVRVESPRQAKSAPSQQIKVATNPAAAQRRGERVYENDGKLSSGISVPLVLGLVGGGVAVVAASVVCWFIFAPPAEQPAKQSAQPVAAQQPQQVVNQSPPNPEVSIAEKTKAAEQALLAEKQKLAEQTRLAELERQRKEIEQKRRREEWLSPKLVPKVEDIDNYPDKFFNQYVRIENVKLSGSGLKREREISKFVVAISSARDKFYPASAFGSLFFTTSDKIGNALLKDLPAGKEYFNVTLFCEVLPHKRRFGNETIPEVNIYYIAVFNAGGKLSISFEN